MRRRWRRAASHVSWWVTRPLGAKWRCKLGIEHDFVGQRSYESWYPDQAYCRFCGIELGAEE